MRALSKLLLIIGTTMLCSCGTGHGFEGRYLLKQETIDRFFNMKMPTNNIKVVTIESDSYTVGSDVKEFEQIYVRNTDEGKFLVFANGSTEEVWRITQADRLERENGIYDDTLIKIIK